MNEPECSYRESIEQARKVLDGFMLNCPHHFRDLIVEELEDKWMSVVAHCEICDRNLGWRCKLSPKQYCEYNEYAPAGPDVCIYCGHPDERN